jgi:alanyl-tRNA synthetase
MSIRLEQQDSYATHFTSTVTAVQGKQVSLAESLFYPTSGGQLHDTGTLNGFAVTDVIKDSETVWHRVNGHFEPGQTVTGIIDWQRRYCHMQRHTAQHLLSQAFLRVNTGYTTEAVSLRSDICTIDIAGQPDSAALAQAETLVTDIIYQALPIHCFEVDASELEQFPLRRPAKVTGRVRLVQIGDFDLSACGGTHLRSAAEAAPIKLLGQERIRNQLSRVSFICGHAALHDYQLKHALITELSQQLSVPWSDIPGRLEVLSNELKQQTAAAADWQARYCVQLSETLLAQARPTAHGRLVRYVLGDDAQLLTKLASVLTQTPGVIALLASRQNHQVRLLYARGEGIKLDMLELLKASLPAIQGRGGGRHDWAQGGGILSEGLDIGLNIAEASITGTV